MIFNLLCDRIHRMVSLATLSFGAAKSTHKSTTINDRVLDVCSFHEPWLESEDYLQKQILTYIGNKRSLLKFITKGIQIVQKKLGKAKLDVFDVFSGSGIVARYFKQFADNLFVNDLENTLKSPTNVILQTPQTLICRNYKASIVICSILFRLLPSLKDLLLNCMLQKMTITYKIGNVFFILTGMRCISTQCGS